MELELTPDPLKTVACIGCLEHPVAVVARNDLLQNAVWHFLVNAFGTQGSVGHVRAGGGLDVGVTQAALVHSEQGRLHVLGHGEATERHWRGSEDDLLA